MNEPIENCEINCHFLRLLLDHITSALSECKCKKKKEKKKKRTTRKEELEAFDFWS